MSEFGLSPELLSRVLAIWCVVRVITLTKAEFLVQMSEDIDAFGEVDRIAFGERTRRAIRWAAGVFVVLSAWGYIRDGSENIELGTSWTDGFGLPAALALLVYALFLKRSADGARLGVIWSAMKVFVAQCVKAALFAILPIPDSILGLADWLAAVTASLLALLGFLPLMKRAARWARSRIGPVVFELRERRRCPRAKSCGSRMGTRPRPGSLGGRQ